MAVTITDHRTIRNEAESATGWTGTTTTGTTDPVPVEASGWLGGNVGVEIFDSYHTATAVDLSNAVVYCWVFSRLSLGNQTDTNGGLMVLLSDATPDRIAYKVAGADVAAFRHDEGPTGWQCPALDTQSLPASPLVRAGAAANIDLTNITAIGTCVNSLVAAPGMNPNYNVDIIRYLLVANNNGCAASIIGGTSGNPGTWAEIAAADRSTGNQQAHGLVRRLATGAFGVQGPLRFGNATGSAASWFEDSNVTVVFEDRGFRTTLYKIFLTDNGTGTTTFRLHGSALVAPTGVGAEFDADTDTDVTDVVIDSNSRIAGFIGGIGLQAGHIVTDTTISASGVVRANGATMNGSSVLLSTVAADASALRWNVNTDPDGLLDDMTFSKGTNAHHAIEFGTSSPLTMTVRGMNTTGFNAANGQNDSTFHVLRTTSTVTINVIGGTGNFSYKTAGATVVIVIDPVDTAVNVKDTAGANIQNARVLIRASAGPLPFNSSVTIVNSGTTATVTHTAHGMINGDKVQIKGASHFENNGIFTITYIGVNSYSYTMASAPGSSPTGTITSTFVALEGLTNASGNVSANRTYSASQPISGKIRKASSSPYYRTTNFTGTIDSVAGFSTNQLLLPDE